MMADYGKEKAESDELAGSREADAALFTHKLEPYDSNDPDRGKSEEERAQLVSRITATLSRYLI